LKDTEKQLKEELNRYFDGQNQRLTMLVKLVLALIKMCTVNYSKLSLVINPLVKKSSNFKRIQRFVKGYKFSRSKYIQFVWSLFCKGEKRIVLSIDRTNWKFGKANINILMIGISYKGTAIPLIWKMLDKQGNSNQKERIKLVKKMLKHLKQEQVDQIGCITADREFLGYKWIEFLVNLPFHFFIRIKKNALVSQSYQEKGSSVYRMFKGRKFKALRKKRWIYGHRLFIGGQQLKNDKYLILISDLYLNKGLDYYKQRWGIEVFFSACKTRGFNFEETHVIDPKRLSTIIYLISIAFCWAYIMGEWIVKNGYKIPIKKLKKRKAKLFSIFRIGLDQLKMKLLNFCLTIEDIKVLSCT